MQSATIMIFLQGSLLVLCAYVAHGKSLGSYGADRDKVSISGLSSGGFMTVQMMVAHSATFMGAGVIAGGPYYCAQASPFRATGECMETGDINVAYLQYVTSNTESTNTIDPLDNMWDQRVYLFSGTEDTVVVQSVMGALQDYLQPFVDSANIKTQFQLPAGHAFITDNFGNSCAANADPFISNCDSNEAFNILEHIYGELEVNMTAFITLDEDTNRSFTFIQPQKPASLLSGEFYEFEQSEFRSLPNSYSMDDTGYVYVPSACSGRSSGCKVHVVLHGCAQGKKFLGDECAMNTGYNEVAESNNIIIIYPQAIDRPALGNPHGCWDWWGYTGLNYASKLGDQVKAIKKMVDRVLS